MYFQSVLFIDQVTLGQIFIKNIIHLPCTVTEPIGTSRNLNLTVFHVAGTGLPNCLLSIVH